jgi:3-hydroxyisobutyrate dehydrogenase-like beta-hydroxyacid dehydrogenase
LARPEPSSGTHGNDRVAPGQVRDGVEKLGEMQRHEYPAGFPVRLALKDLELVREVASSAGVELPLADAVLERFGDVESRHADDDLAAVYELKLPSRADR